MDFSSLNGAGENLRKGRYELIEKGSQHLNVIMCAPRSGAPLFPPYRPCLR